MTVNRTELAARTALNYFAQRFNCAEATLLGLVEAFELDRTNVPRIATAFGAGLGGRGDACGALSGALMALGLRFGREDPEDQDAKAALYVKARGLFEVFEARFDTTQCIDLTQCDFTTPEGIEKSRDLDLHNTLCPKFVEFAAREAAKLIAKG